MENPRFKPGQKPDNPRFEDLEGRRFGITTATKYLGKLGIQSYWEYVCDCGESGKTSSVNLKAQKSCGCLHRQHMSETKRTHGETIGSERSTEYHIWSGIKKRCHLKPHEHYGARGIKMCDEWLHGDGEYDGFTLFLVSMGRRPSKLHTLDRIDVNGDYEPSNCRWATWKEQQRNKRNNHKISWGDEVITLQEACDRAELADVTVHARLRRGWDIQRALSEPSQKTGLGGKCEVKVKEI